MHVEEPPDLSQERAGRLLITPSQFEYGEGKHGHRAFKGDRACLRKIKQLREVAISCVNILRLSNELTQQAVNGDQDLWLAWFIRQATRFFRVPTSARCITGNAPGDGARPSRRNILTYTSSGAAAGAGFWGCRGSRPERGRMGGR
jgi:hypothetical protein